MACAAIDRRGAALAKGIVVTVHGLYGGIFPFCPLHSWLRMTTSFETQSFYYTPRHQDLESSGRLLGEFLQYHKPHTTDDSVHFVTYDYGALVLREAFLHVDWNHTRSKIVMIAPPNRGVKYYRTMKENLGMVGYGGTAANELANWTANDLDVRLGKLPRRCYPLVLAGSLCLNPFNQGNYPNDGILMVEETALPGEFRHQIIPATHYTLPIHPSALHVTTSFLEA